METNNDNKIEIPQGEVKEQEKNEENWEEYDSEEEQIENRKMNIEKKYSKKEILKDKYGEILITKLDTYREPHKQVKETRGDVRLRKNYNFGDLSFDDEDREKDNEGKIVEKLNESEEESGQALSSEKKKKNKKENDFKEDLDELLKEFGVDVKSCEKKEQQHPKQQKLKVKNKPGENKFDSSDINVENKPSQENAKEEKKTVNKIKRVAGEKVNKKLSHMKELKREILERKDALKKKEKKKGL